MVKKGESNTFLFRETAEELNLLCVGPIQVNNIADEHSGIDIHEKYNGLFEGVSLLEGYELKLNIDESLRPVAQPICRNPSGLRQKLDDKLDELLKEGFTEEVQEGPTGSISPLISNSPRPVPVSPLDVWYSVSPREVQTDH